MAGYEKFLRDIGISFEWRVNKESKKLEYRDLTGPEKILVMQKKFQSQRNKRNGNTAGQFYRH